jgi:putative transposase
MKRIPRPVLRALEALAQSPINTSALAMAEGQDFAHDTLYRALNQPLASFFELSLELCKAMGGLDRGYLILDDVLIQGRVRILILSCLSSHPLKGLARVVLP